MTMQDEIRQVLAVHAKLPVDISTLADGADLFQAGMTSHASVNVMLALEDTFDIEFPESMLRKGTFESVTSIKEALETLTEVAPS